MCRLPLAVQRVHVDEALMILQERSADEEALQDAFHRALWVESDDILPVMRGIIQQLNGLPQWFCEPLSSCSTTLVRIKNINLAAMLVREYGASAAKALILLMRNDRTVNLDFAVYCLKQSTEEDHHGVFAAACFHDSCYNLVEWMLERNPKLACTEMSMYMSHFKQISPRALKLLSRCPHAFYELPPNIRHSVALSDEDMTEEQKEQLHHTLMCAQLGVGDLQHWNSNILGYAILADNITAARAVGNVITHGPDNVKQRALTHLVAPLDRHRFMDMFMTAKYFNKDVLRVIVNYDAVNCMRVVLAHFEQHPYMTIDGKDTHIAIPVLHFALHFDAMRILQLVLDWPMTATAPAFTSLPVLTCRNAVEVFAKHHMAATLDLQSVMAKTVLQRYDETPGCRATKWAAFSALQHNHLCVELVKHQRVDDIEWVIATQRDAFDVCCVGMVHAALSLDNYAVLEMIIPYVSVLKHKFVLRAALEHKHQSVACIHIIMKYCQPSVMQELSLEACKNGKLYELQKILDSGYVDSHELLVVIENACPPCMLLVLQSCIATSRVSTMSQQNKTTMTTLSAERQAAILQPLQYELEQLYDFACQCADDEDGDDDLLDVVCRGIVMEDTALRMRMIQAFLSSVMPLSVTATTQT